MVGVTLVSFISIPCFLNKYQSSSIGIDEKHTDKVDYELHQFGVVCGDKFDKSLYLYRQSSLRPMESATTAPPDLVVMAQQIQALTINV